MGLSAATGGRIGVITAGNSGTVVLWPEAELRSAAEADGLTIGPTYESAGDAGSQLSKVGCICLHMNSAMMVDLICRCRGLLFRCTTQSTGRQGIVYKVH